MYLLTYLKRFPISKIRTYDFLTAWQTSLPLIPVRVLSCFSCLKTRTFKYR